MRLKFVGRNGGKDDLTNDQVALMREFAQWVLNKFVSKRVLKNVVIVVHLDSILLAETDAHGQALWRGDRPKEHRGFDVYINTSDTFQDMLHTMAHELVHVKQWILGEFYDLQRGDDCYMFRGDKVDATKLDYWEYPWEIEAHGRSLGLLRLWIKETGRGKKKWAKGKLTY